MAASAREARTDRGREKQKGQQYRRRGKRTEHHILSIVHAERPAALEATIKRLAGVWTVLGLVFMLFGPCGSSTHHTAVHHVEAAGCVEVPNVDAPILVPQDTLAKATSNLSGQLDNGRGVRE